MMDIIAQSILFMYQLHIYSYDMLFREVLEVGNKIELCL